MKLEGTGKLLRIFVGEADRYHGQPLHVAIVERARKEGLSGATAFKGIEGFGGHSVVHAARVFDLSADMPMLIEIVDTEEKIRAFIPLLDEMVTEGLITLESVEVIHYKTGSPKAQS
jgi:PII-like signaling protein